MHALNRLALYVNTHQQDDAYYTVADSLLKHLYELSDMTIYEWADLCNVSTSTISRSSKSAYFTM